MEKYTRLLPLATFSLYFLKVIALGATFQDSLILLVLAAFSALVEYKNSDQKIKELTDKVDGRQKELETYVKDIENLKSAVSSMKVAAGMRPMNNVNNR